MSLRTIIVTVILIWYWYVAGAKPLGGVCVYIMWATMYLQDKRRAEERRKSDEEYRKWKDDYDRRHKKGKYAVNTTPNSKGAAPAVTKTVTSDQEIKKKEEQLKALKNLSDEEGYGYVATVIDQMEQEIEEEKAKRRG